MRAAALLTAAVVLTLAIVAAPVTADERRRHHDFDLWSTYHADILRLLSADRAAAGVYYPDVLPGMGRTEPAPDYAALSEQIARLGVAIQSFQSAQGATLERGASPPAGENTRNLAPPIVPPPFVGGIDPVRAIYGPDGPTIKSVRLMLEYRLLVIGNPRLSVGKIQERSDAILASVVTREGSVVEEYAVDRTTGVWRPVR